WIAILSFAILRLFARDIFNFIPYLRAITLFPIGEIEPRQIWTLRHEFLFYTIFCISVIVSKKWYIIIAWIISPLIWFGGLHTLVPKSAIYDLCSFFFSYYNLLFGIGCLIGVLYKKGLISFKFSTKIGFILCLAACLVLYWAIWLLGFWNNKSELIYIITSGVISGLIIIFSISMQYTKTLSFIDKIGVILGDASYSIYLFHGIAISGTLGIWSKIQPDAHPVLILSVTSLLAIVFGTVIHFIIEKPLIKIISKNKK
ncbi:MAG: acyltransferase, partial [Endomicrobiia bacterium]